MDATLTLDEIDRHVSAIFDINVAATHCIRLVCQDCGGLSILPVPGPGVDEDRPCLCPGCVGSRLARVESDASAPGGEVVGVPRRAGGSSPMALLSDRGRA